MDGCSFVDEVVMSDVYYDDSAFSLSLVDHWLRSRDNTWYSPFPTSTSVITAALATRPPL